MKSNLYHTGFTLIELMVALVLGLLITAAALQLFYTSSLTANIQKAGSGIVDSGTFGFDFLLKQLRKANYGANPGPFGSYYLNAETPQGGIVLTGPTDLKIFGTQIAQPTASNANATITVGNNLQGLSTNNNLISNTLFSQDQSQLSSSNVRLNGTAINSDQLTIQYQVPADNYQDCQGRNVKQNDYVIERYFVRTEGLACESAIYTYNEAVAKKDNTNQNAIDITKYKKPDNTDATSSLNGSGEIIIPNVDYFRVLLGITDSKNFSNKPETYSMSYIPIPTDPRSTLAGKRIVNIQIALLVRSDEPVTASANPNFNILDRNSITLKPTSVADGKMRKVIQSTILIRNARGSV